MSGEKRTKPQSGQEREKTLASEKLPKDNTTNKLKDRYVPKEKQSPK